MCPHVKGQESQQPSHLSCLAFCSRDLLSPITDMAWKKKYILISMYVFNEDHEICVSPMKKDSFG